MVRLQFLESEAFLRDGTVGVSELVKYTSQKKKKEVRSENKSEEETDSP